MEHPRSGREIRGPCQGVAGQRWRARVLSLQSVGWAKARSARAHQRRSEDVLVGTRFALCPPYRAFPEKADSMQDPGLRFAPSGLSRLLLLDRDALLADVDVDAAGLLAFLLELIAEHDDGDDQRAEYEEQDAFAGHITERSCFVVAGLDPAIHARGRNRKGRMDARVTPGFSWGSARRVDNPGARMTSQLL